MFNGLFIRVTARPLSVADSFSLLLGTSGVGISKIAQKIPHFLKNSSVAVFDIENELCSLGRTTELLQRSMSVPSPRMYHVTYYLTRQEVGDLWAEAVNNCLARIRRSSSPINILAGHVTYYGAKRKEFYSVIDASLLKRTDWNVSSVALLTDDVYDMYARLSTKRELFDIPNSVTEYFDKISSDRQVAVRSLGESAQAALILQLQKNQLLTILSWRALETVFAENLAIQLRSKFMLWGAKQRIDSYTSWIKGSRSVYLSHSISEPRRRLDTNKKEWIHFTAEVNGLQKLSVGNSIALVMPTAIDESRFDFDTELKSWTGKLLPRWPLLPKRNMLFVPPNGTDDSEHTDVLMPKVWNYNKKQLEPLKKKNVKILKAKIGQEIEDLAEQIQFQIALRDHLLVSHCEGLLVYRPFWGGRPKFSRGVAAEVEHWKLLATSDKRAAFVHVEEDIADNFQDGRWIQSLRNEIQNQISTRYRVNSDIASELIDARLGAGTGGGVLSSGTHPDLARDIDGDWESLVVSAKTEILRLFLTANTYSSTFAGIFLFKDESDFRNSFSKIVDFLSRGLPVTNGWEQRVIDLFPSELSAALFPRVARPSQAKKVQRKRLQS